MKRAIVLEKHQKNTDRQKTWQTHIWTYRTYSILECNTIPVWLSWEVLWLLRDMPTMACILAPILERLFLSSVPTVPTAVSDWLPSVFSRLHISPLTLVLLVMFMPPEEPICLFFILDAKSLSATAIDRGSCEDRQRRGQGRGEERGCERRDDGRRKDR